MAVVVRRKLKSVQPEDRRAAVYSRVSKVDDPKTGSLDTQERGGVEKCLGLKLDRDHIDTFREKFTGEELWYRPIMSKIREGIREGRYQLLVCHCIDRLARDPVDQAVVIKEARRWGCEVLFVTETFEDSANGDLLRYVKGFAAKLEIASIKERTNRGRVDVLRRGGLTQQGYAAYGYAYTQTNIPARDRTVRAARDRPGGGRDREADLSLRRRGRPSTQHDRHDVQHRRRPGAVLSPRPFQAGRHRVPLARERCKRDH